VSLDIKKIKKILVLRPDRIGDVVLSTPVLRTLKAKFPKTHLSFLVQPFLAPLLKDLDFIDEVIECDVNKSAFVLIKEIKKIFKERNFDCAVHLQSHPSLALSSFLAAIPFRIGPLSKPHSYMFYNYGVRQSRSQVKKHEALYNLDLLVPLGVSEKEYILETKIFISKTLEESLKEKYAEVFDFPKEKTVLFHPGMRGSAQNCSLEFYLSLMNIFLKEGYRMFLSAGESEQSILDFFSEKITDKNLFLFGGTKSPLSLSELGALMKNCEFVVAPSTGPLHMAHALGLKTLSFYPNILVQSQKRWGPFGGELKKSLVITPGSAEKDMQSISPDEVFKSFCMHFF